MQAEKEEKMESILDGYESITVETDHEHKEELWQRGCVYQAMEEYAHYACSVLKEENEELKGLVRELWTLWQNMAEAGELKISGKFSEVFDEKEKKLKRYGIHNN